jgi:hypothetical protein
MGYYVDLDVDELAEEIWKGHDEGQGNSVFSTVTAPSRPPVGKGNDVNPC